MAARQNEVWDTTLPAFELSQAKVEDMQLRRNSTLIVISSSTTVAKKKPIAPLKDRID